MRDPFFNNRTTVKWLLLTLLQAVLLAVGVLFFLWFVIGVS